MGKLINLRIHLPNWITKLFPEAIWYIPTGQNVLYLTFDDGPIPEVTPLVLDILKQYGIKATFFCVGENVLKYPEVYKQIIKDGHSVGNHTLNHLQGLKCSNHHYLRNIEKANSVIKSNMFRPPHGSLKRKQYKSIIQKYKLVMWDVISCDYDTRLTPEICYNNVMSYVRDGSIITFHDSIKAKNNVLNTLPKVIEDLSKQGFSFKKIEFPEKAPLKVKKSLSKKINVRNITSKFLKGA